MTAIDLYSGIGGWTLGLRAAGIDVVGSFERWPVANAAHGLNFGQTPPDVDIRALELSELPEPGSIDFVVGSPPCTQFSFANRGGSGDLEDGLVDIRKFLQVVRYLRPRAWAMENVPRVKSILEKELGPGGGLSGFADLVATIVVVDASEFGLPQARRRMLAGNFDAELLLSYRRVSRRKTLGDVLCGLEADPVVDPNWGFAVPRDSITDHARESPLTAEETRMNRAAKSHHPVYNLMSFPDRLDRPSRTVTATCTRVSRESIVVEEEGRFRRLTIRERAALQGFPLTYAFGSGGYSDRAKMIGNAVPPVLTYFIAQALTGMPAEQVGPAESSGLVHAPSASGDTAQPATVSRSWPLKRSFRYAIPGLRFHSGVRFELRNVPDEKDTTWRIDFYYGNSKRIVRGDCGSERVSATLNRFGLGDLLGLAQAEVARHCLCFAGVSGQELQLRWSGRSEGPGPFVLLDALGRAAAALVACFDGDTGALCARELFPDFNEAKFERVWRDLLAGSLVAATWEHLGLRSFSCAFESEASASGTGPTEVGRARRG